MKPIHSLEEARSMGFNWALTYVYTPDEEPMRQRAEAQLGSIPYLLVWDESKGVKGVAIFRKGESR
jgi:hypothetical protein